MDEYIITVEYDDNGRNAHRVYPFRTIEDAKEFISKNYEGYDLDGIVIYKKIEELSYSEEEKV